MEGGRAAEESATERERMTDRERSSLLRELSGKGEKEQKSSSISASAPHYPRERLHQKKKLPIHVRE